MDHCQLQHSMEVDGQFFEAGSDASAFFHPTHTLFDNMPLAIGRFVKPGATIVTGLLVVLVGNHRFDAASAQPVADMPCAITLVGNQFLGTLARTSQSPRDGDPVHHLDDLR